MKKFNIGERQFLFEDYGQNLNCRLTGTEEEGVTEVKINFEFEKATQPKKVSFTYSQPAIGTDGVWSVCGGMNRYLTPDWGPFTLNSRSVSGYPVLSVVSFDDKNAFTASVSDAERPCSLKVGYREERSILVFTLELFTDITEPVENYQTELFIDLRNVHFAHAVGCAVERMNKKYDLKPAPDLAFKPFFSTWYCFHQELYRERVLEECRKAKELGLESVIIDDGWETDDTSRGFAFAGDYRPSMAKLGDIKTFVKEVHGMGLKCMLWYSVAFSGDNSPRTEEFKDMALYHDSEQRAYVIDPRFKKVREHIISYCVEAIKDWGFDGLKLDFIDWFHLTPQTVERSGIDCLSIEEGINRLAHALNLGLKAVREDVCIEFRQRYVGPVMQRLGNMLRVGDCPGSLLQNRISQIDLRLIAGERAVHSDPIEWNVNEKPENTARYFINCIFSVLQYSVFPSELTKEQLAVSKNYIAFMKEYEAVLLHGNILPKGLLSNYISCKAVKNNVSIIALYADTIEELSEGNVVLLNGSASNAIAVNSNEKKYNYMVRDCFGNIVGKGNLCGYAKIDAPIGAFIFCEKVE